MEYKVGDIIWLDLKVMDVKRGGFGIVYICYSNQWEHMVAAKSFQDKYLEREEIVQGFYREAEILMKLGRHPNIINAIQIIHPDNKPHILLEYIGGGSLTDWVKEGCRDVRRSLDFAIQFCEGMIYLNSLDMGGGKMGVVLRDIRPSNIMLTKEGVVKIIIPNLVKILGTPTAENPAGMPRYMSPEQFRTMDVDQRSDIYSFGVVLYEMFTGKQPFPEPKDLGIWAHYEHHHTKTKPSPLRQINPLIPERLELVVIKCLEKRPEDRYQSFEALKKDLIEIHQTFCGGRLKTEEGTEDVTAEAWYNKGMSLRELDKYWEAVECFNRALEINPRHAEAWSEKGNCLANLVAELEDFFEAEYCFDKALEINPGFAKAWNNKGVCLIRQGEMWKWLGWRGHEEAQLGCLQKAIKCFDKATEIDPKYAEAWRNKGSALCWLGLRCCDIALEIDPNDEWTRDLKEKVLEALRRAKRTQSES